MLKKKESNQVNIKKQIKPIEVLPDTPIYHTMRGSRFWSLINSRTITLTHPSDWSDPHEAFLKNFSFIREGFIEHYGHKTFDNTFGQCWMLKEECEGAWRRCDYSMKYGVKIKTTVEKLREAVGKSLKEVFIYQLAYYPYPAIKDFFTQIGNCKESSNLQSEDIINTLFIKREEFEYEKEVRLLVMRSEGERSLECSGKKTVLRSKIDPISLIDEIVFAPKTEECSHEKGKSYLVKFGFKEEQIHKSDLYEDKRYFVNGENISKAKLCDY